MSGLQIDRIRTMVRHVPDSERVIAFTLEGTVSRDRFDDLVKLMGDIGSVTCNATHLLGHEVGLASPSILTEYVLVDEDQGLFELAVTEEGLTAFVEAEYDIPTIGGTIFRRINDHYNWRHDRKIMENVRRYRKREGIEAVEVECDCPLVAVKSPDYLGVPRTAGFRPRSLVEMVESRVPINGIGRVRRQYLNAAARKLRVDMEKPEGI